MKLSDLRPKGDRPEPSEFIKELVDALPYSEIPRPFRAQGIVEFFLEHGWRPPESSD